MQNKHKQMSIKQALIVLNDYAVYRKFFFNLFSVYWKLGRRRLFFACEDLLGWLYHYEESGPLAMTKVADDNRAGQAAYVCLFSKFPVLNDYFVYGSESIDFRESISMDQRLELSRFVKSLPQLAFT